MGRHPEKPVPSKDDLLRDYVEKGMFRRDLNQKYSRFDHWLRVYEIPCRGRPLTDIQKSHFSPEQLQIIYGCVLGDGSLSIPEKCRWPSLSIEHSLVQQEYVEWLHSAFGDFSAKLECYPPRPNVYHGRTILGKGSIRFRIGVHPDLLPIYQDFYPAKKKCFSLYSLQPLTELALAIWYLDDGSKRKQRTYHKPYGRREYLCDTYELAISTGTNHISEQHTLQGWLFAKWNLKTSLRFLDDSGYRLQFSGDDARSFLALVTPYIEAIPSMLYKVKSVVKVE
jgi:hypothetical protein